MSRFHAAIQAHERELDNDLEASRQFEEQYAAAHDGVYNRDREAQHVLDGVHASPQRAPSASTHLRSAGSAGPPGRLILPGGDAPDPQPQRPRQARGGPPLLACASAPAVSPGRSAVPGGGGKGPSLERPSVVSTHTLTAASAGSSEDLEQLQVIQQEDGGALHRFVTRTTSLSKDDFEELLKHTGMFNVINGSVMDRRLLRSHLPPSKLESMRGRPARRRRNPRADYRSVFNLPLLRPDSGRYVAWSTIVLLSDLTYSAFIVPISIGLWTSFYIWNLTTICDLLFGVIFCVDIFVTLHVGFIATCGTRKLLVMNGKLVARHYWATFGFVVDLLSTLAWVMQIGLIVASHSIATFNPGTALIVMEVVRLMRFVRVVRLFLSMLKNGVLAALVVESSYLKWLRNQAFLSLLYLLYMMAVVVSFLGCLYNFTAGAQNWEGTWVNFYRPFMRKYGAAGELAPLTQEEARSISSVYLYFVGVYWALSTVATVGFGDIVPQNEVEVLVVIFVEVCGVLFFGLLISAISELLAHANRSARRIQAFRNKMQSVERWMTVNILPPRLRRRIKTYYAEIWVRQHEEKEETVLFQELPHALRNEVAWQACKGMFGKVPLLQELDDKTLYLLASKMTPFRFGPGHDLVTEGDPADRFWILIDGEVIALYQYHEAERLEGPAVIGESVLLQDHEEALRTFPCTYRTLTSCTCWMVRCRDFKPMLSSRPGLHDMVKARALQSLSRQMQRYPEMWRGKGLKRLDADSLQRRSTLAPSKSAFPGVGLTDGSDADTTVHSAAGVSTAGQELGGAAAVLSRLARTSAPATGPRHFKSVSWGGERMRGFVPSMSAGDTGVASTAGPSRAASAAPSVATTARAAGRASSPDGDISGRSGWAWNAAAAAAQAAVDDPGGSRRAAGQPLQSAFAQAAAANAAAGAVSEWPAIRNASQEEESAPGQQQQQQQQWQQGAGSGEVGAAGERQMDGAQHVAPPAAAAFGLLQRQTLPSVSDESPGVAPAHAGDQGQVAQQPRQGDAPWGAVLVAEADAEGALGDSRSGSQHGPPARAGGGSGGSMHSLAGGSMLGSPLAADSSAAPQAGLGQASAEQQRGAGFGAAQQALAAVAEERELPGGSSWAVVGQPGAAQPLEGGQDAGGVGAGASGEGGELAEGLVLEGAGPAGLPMGRLTTAHALQLLQRAAQERREEEQQARVTAEAMSAAALAALTSGGAAAPGQQGEGDGGAMSGQQHAAVLAAVLAELQAMRSQLDKVSRWRQST